MEKELQEKLNKYVSELKAEEKNLNEEMQILQPKMNGIEDATRKEKKRYKKIMPLLNNTRERLNYLNELSNGINTVHLAKLNLTNFDATKNEDYIDVIVKQVTELNQLNDKAFMVNFKKNQYNANTINSLESDLVNTAADLEEQLQKAKKAKKINKLNSELEAVNNMRNELALHKKRNILVSTLENDLKDVITSNTQSVQTQIITDYSNALDNYGNMIKDSIEYILNVPIEEKAKKEKKKSTLLEKISIGKVARIGAFVIAVAVILTFIKKSNNNNNNKDKHNDYEITTTTRNLYLGESTTKESSEKTTKDKTEPTTKESSEKTTKDKTEPTTEDISHKKEMIDTLVEKGYEKDDATLIVEHLGKDEIQEVIDEPFIKDIDDYAVYDDFNLDYIRDYQEAKELYGLSNRDAVDYVNRAYKIDETKFFSEYDILDIVNVVNILDDKELYKTENAVVAQSFVTPFNRIVDNYLFGTTTEDDINKLEAFKHFASDNKDMDKFLTELGILTQNTLKNPKDSENNQKTYEYVATFALSLNGFTNTDETIPLETPYNEKAQLNDYFDWYIAYNVFIKPLYPIYAENDLAKWQKLQYIMESALEGPEFTNICGYIDNGRGK